jgi:hypothetical protein
MGWTTEEPGFDSEINFSLLHSIQTGSEAHPTSHIMGTGFFPWVKATRA